MTSYFGFYYSDLHVYNIDTKQCVEISEDTSQQNGPDAGFTQRATLDPTLNEIYVFSGMSREKPNNLDFFHNTLWLYNIQADKW